MSTWINLDNASLPRPEFIDIPTLLQVDITAIVGIFIFLTVAQFWPSAARPWLTLASLLVIPFALSALTILVEDIWSSEYIIRVIAYNFNLPKIFAFVGFLLIFVVFYGLYRNLKSLKDERGTKDRSDGQRQ